MIDLGIEALLIMNKAGIPLLFQQLDPKKDDLEPILLSGFLTAVKAFSSTLVDDAIADFHLDYGKRLITILTGQRTIFAVIHNKQSTDRISTVLVPLLKEFEDKFSLDGDIGEVGPMEKFDPFKERIATVMGLTNPSLEWIPFWQNAEKHDEYMNHPLQDLINNSNTIQEIIKLSKQSQKDILSELSNLWAKQLIKFRNLLSKNDILITTNKIASYLQPSTNEWKELAKEFPNIINSIPFIISYLDGKTTIEKIMTEFQQEGIENIFWLFDYLFINNAISILTPEKRRILMAKEILQQSLEIAAEIYTPKETIQKLRNVLQEIKTPEIISQIRLTENTWSIDYNFIIYDGLTPEKVLNLYEIWLEVLRLFIFNLTEKKRKDYIEKLTEALDYDFFEKYRSEDLDGFEEFAFWLEVVFN